jgi:hypothetical protein
VNKRGLVNCNTHHQDSKESLKELVVSGERIEDILITCKVHEDGDGVF